jgi:hypothetical protein
MTRRIFHSFHYARDSWRVQTILNAGAVEGQAILNSNDWEAVKRGGKQAIQNWIDSQMKGRSCVVVFIGPETAGRPWIDYEIQKGWADGKGVVGVYIHGLKDRLGQQAYKGKNPFAGFTLNTPRGPKVLSGIVKAYDPPYTNSQSVYGHIVQNIEKWIEEAITIRNGY